MPAHKALRCHVDLFLDRLLTRELRLSSWLTPRCRWIDQIRKDNNIFYLQISTGMPLDNRAATLLAGYAVTTTVVQLAKCTKMHRYQHQISKIFWEQCPVTTPCKGYSTLSHPSTLLYPQPENRACHLP